MRYEGGRRARSAGRVSGSHRDHTEIGIETHRTRRARMAGAIGIEAYGASGACGADGLNLPHGSGWLWTVSDHDACRVAEQALPLCSLNVPHRWPSQVWTLASGRAALRRASLVQRTSVGGGAVDIMRHGLIHSCEPHGVFLFTCTTRLYSCYSCKCNLRTVSRCNL